MSYVTEVTELFLSHRPGVTILDPMDYTIIAEWEKQEIPVAIVLRSINEVYFKFKEENIKIESISECHSVVKSNFRAWLAKDH